MLRKNKRLTKDIFSRFFSVSKRFHSPAVQLLYTEHPTLKVAVVVPKKVERGAVQRNILRRRVYTIMRGIQQPGVFILILKPAAKAYTFQGLQKEIINLISQATHKQHTQ